MLTTAFAVAAAILVLATLLPITHISHWVVRGLDFPRLQIAAASVALLTASVLLLDAEAPTSLAIIICYTLVAVYQGWWIFPYTPLFPHQVQSSKTITPERRLRILSSNVLMPNKNANALLALINQYHPDIIVTLESNLWWQQHLDTLADQYPHSIKCPTDNLYGMHVYSKRALKNGRVDYLIDEHIPSMRATITLDSGDEVRLHFLHPTPPSPTENETSSDRDSELIIVAKELRNYKKPVIVTGDLNDVAWSKTTHLFRHLSGLKDPRIGRGMFNTFHASYWFLRWPLDHLFHSDHFALKSIRRLKLKGSDHFALFTELNLKPSTITTEYNNENGEELSEDEQSLMEQRHQEQQAKASNNPSS
ncbi:MAG TPA: endonuclease/exonuclease/phosphatase family protein [Marinagarivorans sp.]